MTGLQSDGSGEKAAQTAISVINSDCEFIKVNKRAAAIHGYSRDEMLDMTVCDLLVNPSIENGQDIEQVLNGETIERELEIYRADGSISLMKVVGEPTTVDGEACVKSTFEVLERDVNNSDPAEMFLGEPFEDIGEDELSEIVQNTRVDAHGGTMTLDEIMLDVIEAQSKVEQYKNGAITLHEAINNRLAEEKRRNAESNTCKVLRKVRDSVEGIYQRIN